MDDAIVVVNAGSSSVKLAVFVTEAGGLTQIGRGQVEGIGTAHPELKLHAANHPAFARKLAPAEAVDHSAALGAFIAAAREHFPKVEVVAVGHRVVHGGPRFAEPVLVDVDVMQVLENYVPLAPLHEPHNLAAMRAAASALPGIPQVACFDTAFHRRHPRVADCFALPRRYHDEGVRRYGFHGLSYEYIASTLPQVAPRVAGGRVVVAHLGSGASMCALKAGQSVDSTMGFTALDGLPMGTRTGQIDPGVVLYLLAAGESLQTIESLFYKKSGLLGLSGISNDMRDLLESRDEAAAFAVEYFVYAVVKQLGALAASLGGLDALVFTAGIGERSAPIRARVCRASAWLGIDLDEEANEKGGPYISAPASPVSAYVIPTNEELMIARHTLRLLAKTGHARPPSISPIEVQSS